MALPNAPAWDAVESCVWFEITYKAHTILCRIAGETLWDYFGARSPAQLFAMPAFVLHRQKIEALAVEKAARGEFDSHPKRPEGIVWLRIKDVAANGWL